MNQETLLGVEQDKPRIVLPDGRPATSEDSKKSGFKIPDALLILALTVFAYICVFAYEAGYCSFFGIPLSLIHPDTTTMLFCGFVSVGAICFLYMISDILYVASQLIFDLTGKTPVVKWCVTTIPILGIMLLVGYYVFEGTFWFVLVLTTISLSISLLPPLVELRRDKKKRGYNYHFAVWTDFRKKNPNPSLYIEAQKKGVGLHVTSVFMSAIVICLCFGFGDWMAKHNSTFLYRSKPRQELVLWTDGSTAITARIENDGKVYPEFRFIKMESETNDFVLIKTGKLTPILPVKKPIPQLLQTTNQPSVLPNPIQTTNTQCSNIVSVLTNAPVPKSTKTN